MKKQNVSTIETKIDKRLEKIENLLKIMDQKNLDMERGLRFEINSSAVDNRERLERSLRAEIQVATNDLGIKLEKELHEVEKRLNKRITDVSDLITIYFGKKIKVLDKRVAHLEQVQQAA